MTASYPNSVKSFTAKTDDVDYVMAEHVNSLQDEVTAIETEVGTNPSTQFATVDARIGALEINPTVSGSLTVLNDITVSDDLFVQDDMNVIGDITVSGSFYTVAYQDYSGSSTVVGWGTLTAKKIEFMKVGKIVFLSWNINGTSNATGVTFTVPYRSIINFGIPCKCIDAGSPTSGYVSFALNSSTATVHSTYTFGSLWTATGTKQITGQCWYLTDL